ncbi:MAG: fibronectin type III domain-containing protein, partial [Micrococcales bacterium]
YSAVQDILSFSIAKATQAGVTIALAHELTYSPSGAVSATLEVNGALSTGAQSFTVTSGTCTVSNGELTATEAGDCEVSVSILGDDKYLDGSFTQTVRIGKAAQTAVSASLIPDALPAIAWNGRNTTTFEIAGGSGDLVYSASTSTPTICSVALTGSQLVVTGIAQGACDISVGNASSANYLAASTVFSVDVLDLAAAPTSVTAANAVRRQDNTLASTVSWNIPTTDSTRAAITGFKVQSKTPNGEWTDVTQDAIAADATSLNVTVAPWTKYNFRVAATTNLDGDTLNWAYFDLSGDNTPDLLAVGGGAVVLSTTKAATTSGETVFVTGSGFQDAGITSVELTTQSPVFAAAGLRPAALLTRKVVPATVISDTKLSFVLPKITLPKGVLTLQASIKVVNSEQLVSDPIPLDYIPKKLTQVLTATLPAPATVINVGTNLISAGTVTSSVTSNPPVVTATPASVCTASINLFNKLEVTPVSPGKCSISIVVPGTPAYLPSATKTAVYTVKSARTPNLSATINDVTETGELGTARTFTKLNATSLIPGVVNVVVGDGPIDIPVTLSAREGTLLFTVAPADDAAGLCTADPGDSTTGLVGSITVSGVGDCHVTISQPADAGWYLGETIVITVHSVERPSTVVVPDNGEASAVTESELAELLDPADPDDPDTPPVAIDLDPTRTTDYAFGGEDGLGYDPLTGKLNVRSRTPLVGTWTATLTGKWTNPIGSDGKPKMWFKIPGKIVKKVQQYTYANVCKLTLTVKKDKKIKKKVTRLVGAGCILSDAGKAALTAVGIQKIKVKYKRIRQYANTGLSYRGTAKAKTRILKNINRTWLVRVGRRS